MNNRTLDLADFAQSNKLNLSVFEKSNLSEGLMTHEQFAMQYPSVEVFSKANLEKFTADAIATKNPEIISKAKEEIALLKAKRVLVPTSEGTKIATIYFRGDNKNNIISHDDDFVDIQKGKIENELSPQKHTANLIEKAEGEDTIEKGITDGLSYDSTLKVKKTGAQIKTALANLQSFLEGKVSEMKRALDSALADFDIKPTNTAKIYVAGSYYGSDTFGMDYKTFPWGATYCNESDGSSKGIDMPEYPGLKTATSQQEASDRSKYNEMVNQCMENCVDIMTCKVLRNSLEDKQSYELSVRQLQILGFGTEAVAEEKIEKGGYVTKSPVKEDDGGFDKELEAIRALKKKKAEDNEEETEEEDNDENGETTED